MTIFNADAIFANDAITSTIKAVCSRTKENYTPTEHDAQDFVGATRVRVMEVYRTSYDFEAAYAGANLKYSCSGFEAVRKLCASIAGRTRETVIRKKYAGKRGHEITSSINADDNKTIDPKQEAQPLAFCKLSAEIEAFGWNTNPALIAERRELFAIAVEKRHRLTEYQNEVLECLIKGEKLSTLTTQTIKNKPYIALQRICDIFNS